MPCMIIVDSGIPPASEVIATYTLITTLVSQISQINSMLPRFQNNSLSSFPLNAIVSCNSIAMIYPREN